MPYIFLPSMQSIAQKRTESGLPVRKVLQPAINLQPHIKEGAVSTRGCSFDAEPKKAGAMRPRLSSWLCARIKIKNL